MDTGIRFMLLWLIAIMYWSNVRYVYVYITHINNPARNYYSYCVICCIYIVQNMLSKIY